jgi:hypothetical protein
MLDRELRRLRRMCQVRRFFGLTAHEPFTFEGKAYDGNRYEKVPDLSDQPSTDWVGPFVQDMTVVPRGGKPRRPMLMRLMGSDPDLFHA